MEQSTAIPACPCVCVLLGENTARIPFVFLPALFQEFTSSQTGASCLTQPMVTVPPSRSFHDHTDKLPLWGSATAGVGYQVLHWR